MRKLFLLTAFVAGVSIGNAAINWADPNAVLAVGNDAAVLAKLHTDAEAAAVVLNPGHALTPAVLGSWNGGAGVNAAVKNAMKARMTQDDVILTQLIAAFRAVVAERDLLLDKEGAFDAVVRTIPGINIADVNAVHNGVVGDDFAVALRAPLTGHIATLAPAGAGIPALQAQLLEEQQKVARRDATNAATLGGLGAHLADQLRDAQADLILAQDELAAGQPNRVAAAQLVVDNLKADIRHANDVALEHALLVAEQGRVLALQAQLLEEQQKVARRDATNAATLGGLGAHLADQLRDAQADLILAQDELAAGQPNRVAAAQLVVDNLKADIRHANDVTAVDDVRALREAQRDALADELEDRIDPANPADRATVRALQGAALGGIVAARGLVNAAPGVGGGFTRAQVDQAALDAKNAERTLADQQLAEAQANARPVVPQKGQSRFAF